MGLESVELVMAWEEHFGIKIPDEIAATMETPRRTIALIEEILNSSGSKRIWTAKKSSAMSAPSSSSNLEFGAVISPSIPIMSATWVSTDAGRKARDLS